MGHEVLNVLIIVGNLHALTAQYIGGAHQHRIADPIGNLLPLFSGKAGTSLGPFQCG